VARFIVLDAGPIGLASQARGKRDADRCRAWLGLLGTAGARVVVPRSPTTQKVYETGPKCAEGFKESMKIAFDRVLPKWNYRAIPSAS
jgi:hypothetical protein